MRCAVIICLVLAAYGYSIEKKDYSDANCAGPVKATETTKLVGNCEESKKGNNPTEYKKSERTCNDGFVVSQEAEDCNSDCSTCTGSKKSGTMTSADFDLQIASVAQMTGKCEPAGPGNWYSLTISGMQNPCKAGTASAKVSSRLHEAVALVALSSSVFALQQKQ